MPLLLKVRRIILAKWYRREGSSFHFNKKTILLSVPANKIAPGRLSFGMGSPVMAVINGSFS
jgi:hypothetical protein